MPSAPVAGRSRREVFCQGIVPCQRQVRKRDLAPPRYAELVPEHVGVGLRRARGYAESGTDLLVGAACGNELHHLSLPLREREFPGCLRLRPDSKLTLAPRA